MTREEIEKISVAEPYCFESDREEYWYKIGCTDGLEAADAEPNLESIWHDVNTIPSDSKSIIYLTKNRKLGVISQVHNNKWNWYVANKYSIIKWAYVDDLLPKGGKK